MPIMIKPREIERIGCSIAFAIFVIGISLSIVLYFIGITKYILTQF